MKSRHATAGFLECDKLQGWLKGPLGYGATQEGVREVVGMSIKDVIVICASPLTCSTCS
jgi:hypothetical protein